jgi:excinuclease ABC subunit B
MEGARTSPGAARGKGSARSRRGQAAIDIPEDPKTLGKLMTQLENRMFEHAKNLEFEEAAGVRDQIQDIRQKRLLSP